MAVTRIQRASTNQQTTESNAQSHSESATSKKPENTQSKAQFDNPMAKGDANKAAQSGTQADMPTSQNNVYNTPESARIAMQNKPPVEGKAGFKGDDYNPSSTILRSQEQEEANPEPEDQKVKRRKKRDREEEEEEQKEEAEKKRKKRKRVRPGQTAAGGDGGAPVPAGGGGAGKIQQATSAGAGDRGRLSTVLKGADVMDGHSQDAFKPAASQTHTKVQERSIREQVGVYSLGAVGSAVFTAVSANADPDQENGMGVNMQKILLNQVIEAMSDTPDILSQQYRDIVREIVQGTLQAAKENDIQTQAAIKMLVTGLMTISPHDDDPKIMAEAIKVISSEILYGKLNINYSMKLAAYALGGAMFMLSIYYKNYQKRIEYTKQLDQKLKYACNDGIWEATGEITGYSEEHARANTDRFVAGRIEEEKSFQKNMVKGVILMPLKKLENIPFIRNLINKFKGV